MNRCGWVKMTNPLYVAYHDEEWGIPLHKERELFELLCLETYQAGLSWEMILNKRKAFKEVFHNYDIVKVAAMSDDELEEILQNPAVVRNRLKIYATRNNAQAFISIQENEGSFDRYIWSFVEDVPITNQVLNYNEVPSKTPLSEKISKDLKKKGFKFVGPVAVYSFLQAAGLVNDHECDCDFNPKKSSKSIS